MCFLVLMKILDICDYLVLVSSPWGDWSSSIETVFKKIYNNPKLDYEVPVVKTISISSIDT